MNKLIAYFILIFSLSGCATTPPIVVPQVVKVAVPVPCLVSLPTEPDFLSDKTLASYDDYQLVLALWVDRKQEQDYVSLLKASITGCTVLGTTK